jgi:hypothetical protein
MTDFATESDVIAGLAGCTAAGFSQDVAKTSVTTVSGFDYSGWTMGGNPVAGAAPTTWVNPTQITTGAWNPRYVNGGSTTTARILFASLRYSVANQPVIFYDRIGHMGGLSGTNTGAQTVGTAATQLSTPASDGRCEAGGGDCDWFLEWYSATGSTAVNATCAVTYSDNSTGNVVVALPATVPALRMYRIPPSSANLSIKGISTVTLSATTGTVGNFGVTCTGRKFQFSVPTANTEWVADWATLGMPGIGRNACLTVRFASTGTAAGIITGNIRAGVK